MANSVEDETAAVRDRDTPVSAATVAMTMGMGMAAQRVGGIEKGLDHSCGCEMILTRDKKEDLSGIPHGWE